MGTRPRIATRTRTLIKSKEELLSYVERAFAFYLKHGKKRERFGHTLDRLGAENALDEIFAEPVEAHAGNGGKPESDAASGTIVDLRGICCPMNFVRAKLAIEKVKPHERIEFFLDDGEPIVNVTRSLKDEGHRVLNVVPENSHFRVLVEKR